MKAISWGDTATSTLPATYVSIKMATTYLVGTLLSNPDSHVEVGVLTRYSSDI